MNYDELPVTFDCAGETLVGIVARPEEPADVGVVVVVGGPQYRVGSHRQFVHLSRHLAEGGVACLRFDYRGMGDATGPMRSFEAVSDDIAAAVDALLASVPRVRRIVLWGLCDGASAACFYAPRDPRVVGLALMNPWVRTEAGRAVAYLKHYYWRRLLDTAFWSKLLRGELRVSTAVNGLTRMLTTARVGSKVQTGFLPDRMARSLDDFTGSVLLILSGMDLVAAEFAEVAGSSERWQHALRADRTTRSRLPSATHTFSTEEWRLEVARRTLGWTRSMSADPSSS